MPPKERPILFSAPMVQAILAGHKTQTRRVVKFRQFGPSDTPGYDWHFRGTRRGGAKGSGAGCWQDLTHAQLLDLCPYGVPGDRLYVRETWGLLESSRVGEFGGDIWEVEDYEGDIPSERINERDYVVFPVYRADGGECGRWRPSIHMPRWASRITLEVVSVRVERLQDISEDDAGAEGGLGRRCTCGVAETGFNHDYPEPTPCECGRSDRDWFKDLWGRINGAESWDANPWLWVVEFRRLEAADAA